MHRRLPAHFALFTSGLIIGLVTFACGNGVPPDKAAASDVSAETTADLSGDGGAIPGNSGSADTAESSGQPSDDATPQQPLPENQEASAVQFSPIQVIGYPIDSSSVPSPLPVLASEALQPDYVYQLSWEGPAGSNWQVALRGAKGSELILESFPPQLGNPQADLDLDGTSFAFKVDADFTHLVSMTLEGELADGTAFYKTYFGKTTSYDPDSIDAVAGEVLIGLQPGHLAQDPDIQQLLTDAKLTFVSSLNSDSVIHAKAAPSDTSDFLALHARVIGDPRVQYAEPNYIAHAMSGGMGATGEPVEVE